MFNVSVVTQRQASSDLIQRYHPCNYYGARISWLATKLAAGIADHRINTHNENENVDEHTFPENNNVRNNCVAVWEELAEALSSS